MLVPPESALAEEIRLFVEANDLANVASTLDANPAFPWREFQRMGEAHLLGLRTPGALGGRGLDLVSAGRALFHLAFRSGTTFAKLSLQPEFCSVLAEEGSPELVAEYYRPLVEGRVLVGNHVTEPGAGSDVRRITTRAVLRGDDYVLSGTKSEAAFATEAQAAIVYAHVEKDGTRQEALSAFLVPQHLPGIRRRIAPDLGERWMLRGTVEYAEVAVPSRYRIGTEGEALSYVKPELTRERVLLAAIYLGVAWASWTEVVDHVGSRSAFGRPLASNQAVGFPLVEDGARLRATWLYVAETLERLARGQATPAEAALAKWMATEVALAAIDHAIQFHGGRGYSKELPHEQRWRDVRSGSIAHGPSEVLLEQASRELWPSRRAAPADVTDSAKSR
jgi:alkylation response protein AidB-like acyl-CoA dehydrogenase